MKLVPKLVDPVDFGGLLIANLPPDLNAITSGKLAYAFVQTTIPPVEAMKAMATLNGSTWAEQDGAHHPDGQGTIARYGPNIVACYRPGSQFTSNPFPIAIRPFDLTTNTWGADLTITGPLANGVWFAWTRLDGSIVVIYTDPFVQISNSGIMAAVFSGKE